MRHAILVDTGPIVALLAARDAKHKLCVEAAKGITEQLVTCWPVLTEAAWLLRSDPRAVHAMLKAVSDSTFVLAELNHTDAIDVAAIITKYRTAGAQLADAALLHLAEREKITSVFTLDRRDFSLFRTRSGRALTIVPD